MKFSLSQTLDSASFQFIQAHFKLERVKSSGDADDIIGHNAYGELGWIRFFSDGSASYSPTGYMHDEIDFASHQDAVDFIKIK